MKELIITAFILSFVFLFAVVVYRPAHPMWIYGDGISESYGEPRIEAFIRQGATVERAYGQDQAGNRVYIGILIREPRDAGRSAGDS